MLQVALLDVESFELVSQALEDNKLLVLALSALLVFLTIHFVHHCLLGAGTDEAQQPQHPDHGAADQSADSVSKKSQVDDKTLIDAFENSRPPQDPIHGFMAGDRDKVPFMCPFFEAFKMAQKRSEKEQEEEEFIAKAQQKELEKKAVQSKSAIAPEKKSTPPPPKKDSSPNSKENVKSDNESQQLSATATDAQDPQDLKNVLGNVPFNHLPGCLKRQEQGKQFSVMSEEEKSRERQAVSQQLSEIYALLAQQREAMGDTSIQDMQEQLKLYAH